MRRPRLLSTVLALAAACSAGVAEAQPAPRPSPSAISPTPPSPPTLAGALIGQPKADYESALMLFGVGDYAGALLKFTAAYRATKDARLLFNMATCESKVHHYAKALDLMRRYVTEGGAVLTEQDRAEASEAITALGPLTATLTLAVNEPGATVTLDDQPIGEAPVAPQVVDIGVHKLRVSKPEFVDFSQDVTVSGSVALKIDANLTRVVHEGRVSVRAGHDDRIDFDGAQVGAGEWSGALKSGGHTLRVTAPNMLPYQAEVLVQDGQTRELTVTLNPEPRKGLPLWAWVAGSVVVAGGLGVGAYFLFKPGPATYTGPTGTLNPPGIVMASAPLHF